MSDSTKNHTPDHIRAFAVDVVRKLVANGHRAVFAGGCVRDMLLGQQPKDYDVATAATPQDVMKLFRRTVAVGVAFGVVRVLGPGEAPIQVEVATFRGETTYSDGRHPDQVSFTDEVEDVRRRDFTINGLLFDPLADKVLDYVGGQPDLQQKVVRAIGDPHRRFGEDHLRMLRAIRFATRLDFEIDPVTFGAIKSHAPKILGISAERIRDELSLMLTGPRPRRALELLKKSGLLKHILPEVAALEGVEQPKDFHPEGDVWTHTLLLLEPLSHASLTLALGALLHDIGKPPTFTRTDRIRFTDHERVGAEMTERLMQRLKFSNEEIERVTALVKQHMAFKDVRQMRPATLKRFLRQPHFDEHLALHRLDCMACHGNLECHDFCVEQLAHEDSKTLHPPPLLSGHDLIRLGLKPGPRFKQILKELEDRQLEGALADRNAALEYARRLIAEGCGPR